MRKSLFTAAFVVGLCSAYISDTVKPALDDEPYILPPPLNISYGNQSVFIDPCLKITYNQTFKGSSNIKDLYDLYKPRLFPNLPECPKKVKK